MIYTTGPSGQAIHCELLDYAGYVVLSIGGIEVASILEDGTLTLHGQISPHNEAGISVDDVGCIQVDRL